LASTDTGIVVVDRSLAVTVVDRSLAVTVRSAALDGARRKPSGRWRSLSPKIEDFRDDERATVSRTTRDILARTTAPRRTRSN